MPFTPTHTLAAVPLGLLSSRRGVFSALVIGCMVPDWPLYVPGGPSYTLTHSFSGIAIACTPLGVALAVIYQLFLKRPLFELLPAPLGRRLSRYLDGPPLADWRTVAAITAAVALGATSHIVWDAFTHGSAWGVELLPQLREPFVTIGGFEVPAYSALQHGCTLFGFPLAVLLFAAWYRRAPEGTSPPPVLGRSGRTIWTMVLVGLPAVIIADMTIELFAREPTARYIFRTLFHGVTRAGLAMIVLSVLYGGYFQLVRGRRTAPVAES